VRLKAFQKKKIVIYEIKLNKPTPVNHKGGERVRFIDICKFSSQHSGDKPDVEKVQ